MAVQTRTSPTPARPAPARRGRSPLARLAVAGLLGTGLCFWWLMTLAGGASNTPLLVIGTILVVTAAVSALPSRWAPFVGSMVAIGIVGFGPLFEPYTKEHLAHPEDSLIFIINVLIYAFGFIAAVTGLAAAVRPVRRWPHWTGHLLGIVAGVVLGASAVSLLAPDTGAGAGATVHLGPTAFLSGSARVATGGKLTFQDDGSYEHIIQNGRWAGGSERPAREPGAPAVNVHIQGGSAQVGPFTTAGTYHLFCPIHRGMNLTVTVG